MSFPHRGIELTVLGSGDPFVSPARASSGYIVSVDGRAQVQVDPGGERPLTVIGPAARLGQPGNERFCRLLFGPEGAWRYLHNFTGFGIETLEAPSEGSDARVSTVASRDGLSVRSVAVPHGMMPSVASRIEDGTSRSSSPVMSHSSTGHWSSWRSGSISAFTTWRCPNARHLTVIGTPSRTASAGTQLTATRTCCSSPT